MENFEIRENREIYSRKYGDLYWSREGAIPEKTYIFLDSGGLEERWKHRTSFQILELGFGAGINFLVTLDAWRRRGGEGRLIYTSLEESPLPKSTLENLYLHLQIPPDLYSEFLDSYSRLEKGIHLLSLEGGKIELILMVGNALDSLKNMTASVDAIYLDGFSPVKNPEMWSPEIFRELFRLSRDNAMFTTYSGARMVLENASAAGFEVEKLKGFGIKKWMLRGTKRAESPKKDPEPYYSFSHLKTYRNSDAIVIGGGLAGTSIASALARKGFHVRLIERENGLARKASGNPAGIVNPNLTAGRTVLTLLELNAYLHLQRFLDKHLDNKNLRFKRVGILSFDDEELFQKKLTIHSAKNLYKEFYDSKLDKKGYLLKDGLWINPYELCTANISSTVESSRIKISFNTNLLELHKNENGWLARDVNGEEYESKIVVLANSYDCTTFSQTQWFPLRKFRGQLLYIPRSLLPFEIDKIYNLEDCYIIPQDENYIVGATYRKDIDNENLDVQDSLVLWEKFIKYFPDTKHFPPEKLSGRAGIRATTPDHLPIVGPVPDKDFFESEYANLKKGGRGIGQADAKYLDGIYAFTGFGSKGVLLSNYLAESLTAIILSEFVGLEREVLHAIQPSRFLIRRLMKRKGYET